MGIPLAAFAIVGREDLGLLACTGAVLASYLTDRPRAAQAAGLPVIGIGLVCAGLLGALASGSSSSGALVLFGVAAVAAALVYTFAVGPPGALFFVLSCGVAAHLAAPPSEGGAGVAVGTIAGVTALGCTFAYVIAVGRPTNARPLVRRSDDVPLPTLSRATIRARWRADGRIVLRLVIGSGVALGAAAAMGLLHNYWVLMTVVAVLQGGAGRRVTVVRGVHRVLGTIVGLALFWGLLALDPRGVWLAVTVAVLQLGIDLLVARNYGLALALITPLALTIASHGASSGAGLAAERLGDTLLGAGCAALVIVGDWVLERPFRASQILEHLVA